MTDDFPYDNWGAQVDVTANDMTMGAGRISFCGGA